MASLGGYETVHEFFHSGIGAVATARASGAATDGPAPFAVKTLSPPAGIWAPDKVEAEIERFLARARLQQKCAGANWAPVHGLGKAAGGAYYVGDHYPATAARLVAGQIKLDAPSLYVIMRAVVDGLGRIHESAGRGHGALKPSNVLIAGATLAKAKVVLADPSAEAADADDDLPAVGRLIYTLVTLKPYDPADGWPIGPSPAWSRLGRHGKGWRELCAKLLHPEPAQRWTTLEQLTAEIPRLRASPPRIWLRLAATAAVLALVVMSAGAIYVHHQRQTFRFDQAAWMEFCDDWGNWFSDFYARMDTARRQTYAADPYLKRLVATLDASETAGTQFDPAAIAHQNIPWKLLAEHPSPEAQDYRGVEKTQNALKVMQAIAQFLTPDGWPVLKTLQQTAATYQSPSRGWNSAGAYLDGLVRAAKPAAGSDIAAAIDTALRTQKLAAEIETAWPVVAAARPAVTSADNRLLKQFGRFVDASTRLGSGDTGEQGFATLHDNVLMLADLAPKLAKIVQGQGAAIDWAQMAKDPAMDLAAGAQPTRQMYEAWLAAAPGYVRLTAAENAAAGFGTYWTDHNPTIDSDIKQAEEREDDGAPELRHAFDAFGKQVMDLHAIPAIRKNQVAIQQAADDLRRSIDSLAARAEELGREYKNRVNTYMDQAAQDTIAQADPAIEDTWLTQRQRLLASVSREQLYKSSKTFKRLQAALTRSKGDLQSLETDLPAGADVSPAAPARPWNQAVILAALPELRRATLRGAADAVAAIWPLGVADLQDEKFQTQWKKLSGAYTQRRQNVSGLIGDLNMVVALLNQLYLLDDKPPDGPSAGQLYDAWMSKLAAAFGADSPKVLAAVAEPVGRVQLLRKIAGLTDRGQLVAMTSPAPEPAQPLAAWRRLGQPAVPWPGLPKSLDDEAAMQAVLKGQLASLQDDAHRRALTGELAAGAARRWEATMNNLADGSPQAAESIIARRGQFGGDVARLSDGARYNLLLADMRAVMLSPQAPDDAQVEPKVRAFMAAVGQLKGPVPDTPQVKHLLATLDETLKKFKGGKADVEDPKDMALAKAGLKWTGSRQDVEEEPQFVRFAPPRDKPDLATLEFIRVEGDSAGVSPFYLCTTTVPLGLFADVVAAQTPMPDLIHKSLGDFDPVDTWNGARVWKLTAQGLPTINGSWLFPDPTAPTPDLQYDGHAPPAPSLDHPMQRISPGAALTWALLLNCRLPTSSEWRAAYAQSRSPAYLQTYGSEKPNLRDRTFRVQRDYVAAQQKLPDAQQKKIDWPDEGIFNVAGAKSGGDAPAAVWAVGPQGQPVPSGDGEYDDGLLWTRPVRYDVNTGFHDLLGNVAEYCYEDPESLKGKTAADVPVMMKDKTNWKKFKVIGGSALSPSSLPVDQPLDVDYGNARDGFSDVGLRLAFTAPDESLAKGVKRAVRAQEYLVAAR